MKHTTKLMFLGIVFVLALSACSNITTGIRGQSFLADCTGSEIAVDCTSTMPFATSLTIYDENLVVVKTVKTKKDGSFAIALDPGTYFIHPVNNGSFPMAGDFQVVVTEGEVVELTIQYDTGMR